MRAKFVLVVAIGLLVVPFAAAASGSTKKYTPPHLAFSVRGPAKVVANQSNLWRITVRNTGSSARRRVTVWYMLDSGVTVDPRTKPKPSRVKPLNSGQHMMIWHLGRLAGKSKKYIYARAEMPASYAFSDYCMPVSLFWKGILIDNKDQTPCPPFVTAGG